MKSSYNVNQAPKTIRSLLKPGFAVVLLCLAIYSAYGQAPRCHRRLPFFMTYSVKSLSRGLTRNLNTDSAKIAAVHSWITYNIKYDVKKFYSHNYTQKTVKNILWRKKAVCTGYADLFTALCDYAGIRSVQVPGYSKNIDVDIVDSFYLDDHMWNAVALDSQWRLVDATWDAGYIEYYKYTVFGRIKYIITFGLSKPIQIYKPHFVRSPDRKYYLSPATFFMIDHLPLNYKWQLYKPPVSLSAFEKDSSYYYKQYYKELSKEDSSEVDESYCDVYYNMDADQRTEEDGIKGFDFNHRNHFCKAVAWDVRARHIAELLNKTDRDSLAQVKLCDLALVEIDTALSSYDKNSETLSIQRAALLASNVRKSTYYREYNSPMTATTRKVARNFKKSRKTTKSSIKYCKNLVKAINNRNNQFLGRGVFVKTNAAKLETNKEDSLGISLNIKAINDSIVLQKKRISQWYTYLDSLHYEYLINLKKFAMGQFINKNLISASIYARAYAFDDFDNEVKQFADQLKIVKPENDSLAFDKGRFIILKMCSELRQSSTRVNALYRTYRAKSALLCRLKRKCLPCNSINKIYETNEDSVQAFIAGTSKQMAIWQKNMQLLNTLCKKEAKITGKELAKLINERRLESRNSAMRSNRITHNAAALKHLAETNRTATIRLKNKTERHKQKMMPYKMRDPIRPEALGNQ